MIRWNIAICDDEREALELLGSSVRGALRARIIDATIELFARPRDLRARMKTVSFDLLFLDIEMRGMTGLELAQQLRREGVLVDIIYISNREDLVFDALRTNPRGFIRKTRLIHDVSGVIDTYLSYRKADAQPKALIVKDREQVIYLPIDRLQYIEGSGKSQTVHVVSREQPMELYKSMQELEAELSPHGFLRIHKGYLLNYRFIRRIGDNEVPLTSGEKLPIVNSINCVWVAVAAMFVPDWVYNIGTTVLNGGVSMVIFFFVNKIIFPEAAKDQAAA